MRLFKQKFTIFLVLLTGAFIDGADAFDSANHNTFFSYEKPNKDSVIKILAIGNSFTEDAVEQYLYDLAKADGYKVIIGNLVIGGCSLELHWNNAKDNKAAYSYRKISLDGKKKVTEKVSMAQGIADEKWDYISLQQVSHDAGVFETYLVPLPPLFKYVKQHATNPKVKMMWQQTWAYAQNSTHGGFANYNKDQMTMYKALMATSKKVMDFEPFDIVIPTGTTVQNTRTKLGDIMCRDGFHLNVDYGRYAASCTWYEAIFGQNVVGNTYKPDKVTIEQAKAVQEAAHKAVKKPYRVSKVK